MQPGQIRKSAAHGPVLRPARRSRSLNPMRRFRSRRRGTVRRQAATLQTELLPCPARARPGQWTRRTLCRAGWPLKMGKPSRTAYCGLLQRKPASARLGQHRFQDQHTRRLPGRSDAWKHAEGLPPTARRLGSTRGTSSCPAVWPFSLAFSLLCHACQCTRKRREEINSK